MMAGAALLGILSAILRQPALGAPIRFISLGEKFWVERTPAGESFLQSKAVDWYDGLAGQGISLAMFLGLAVVCFLLAKKGAEWFLREEAAAEGESI
jgi:hypothetical protein